MTSTATTIPTAIGLHQKLCRAADALHTAGRSPFTPQDLAVVAHGLYPQVFGMAGYAEQYPDLHRVIASLSGTSGMVAKGLLDRPEKGRYCLSLRGKGVASRFRPPPRRVRLDGHLGTLLETRLAALAVEKVATGRENELEFNDACRFWNLKPDENGPHLDAAIERTATGLKEVLVKMDGAEVELSGGRVVSWSEVESLLSTDGMLRKRFARHVDLLRNRVGKELAR